MEVILQSYGAKLRIRDGMYRIIVPDLKNLPKQLEDEQLPAHEVKTILLSQGTSASSDALLFALQNDTDIIILDKMGNPAGRLLSNRPNSILTIWRNQLKMSESPHGLHIARSWIGRKLSFQIDFLEKLKLYRTGEKLKLLDRATQRIQQAARRLDDLPLAAEKKPDPRLLDDLPSPENSALRTPNSAFENAAAKIRGIEGSNQRAYLETLSQLLPREYQFSGRSRQPAADLFNLFLNYSYGILYRHVETALLRAGIHPYIGFHHTDGLKSQV